MKLAAVCAAIGAALFVAGSALIYIPAGVIVAGFMFVSAAYVIRYLEANR